MVFRKHITWLIINRLGKYLGMSIYIYLHINTITMYHKFLLDKN